MSIESLALMPLSDGPSSRAFFVKGQSLASQLGVSLRMRPPDPTTCCGRGCNGCVWEGFFTAAAYWREDALEVLQAVQTPSR